VPVIEAAEASSAGPPWLAILLAVIALLSAVAVALAPAVVERIRQRAAAKAEKPAAPAQSADLALGMVDLALRDAWRQRDEAEQRADRLERERDKARAQLARYQARDRGIDA
jgi:hypothetical protein